jgi:ribosomal protein S16
MPQSLNIYKRPCVANKKCFIIYILLLSFYFSNISAQENRLYINGYSKTFYGETAEEDCSSTPDAVTAIIARCTNEKDYIEWETAIVPEIYNSKNVSFIWSGGYSTGTNEDKRTFHLYVNEKLAVTFETASRVEGEDWSVLNGNSELSFKVDKFYNRAGDKKDFWGFFFLTLPASELSHKKPIRIKITGDNASSRHWLRTMEYRLVHKVKIRDEKVIYKDKFGKETQRVKISVENYSDGLPVEIISDGKVIVSDRLTFGISNFYIPFDAVNTSLEKTILVKVADIIEKYIVTLNPVRKRIFYILPHSHVDIGYTELQTEVEIKQWKNIEEGINLSKKFSDYKDGSAFKWNVEVLWAVKSYLENFPEKRESFYEAVRNGWIGLDATYANLLTGLSRPEELYRWLEYSNRLEEEIGVKIESAMISDVPGFTWGTVQAFADNGIKYFSVGTNESDRIGNSLRFLGDKPFYWESPSGKDKILVWLAGKGYSWFHHWDLTKGDISRVANYLEELEEGKYPYEIVHVRYTIGDNGGPNEELPDFISEWNETHVTPLFKIATTNEMFVDFEKKYASSIPTLKGDFTPYWEDGAASSANETSLNRNTAELLTQLEVLYSILPNYDFPFSDFDEAWKNVLLYSEHTWGAYNSISQPETKGVKEQWGIKRSFAIKADSIAKSLLNNIQFTKNSDEKIESLTVWNTNSWKRNDVVTISSKINREGDYLVDEFGESIETQKLANGDLIFIAKDVPPLTSKNYHFMESNPNKQPIDNNLASKSIVTDVFPTELNELIDRDYKYSFNELIHTGKNANSPKTNTDPRIIFEEKGLILNSIIYESSAPGCEKVLHEVRNYNGLNKTEVINTIYKQKIYDKENLRFAFPFNIEKPITRLDIAWSVISPELNQIHAANKNYYTVQRWIDVSNDNKGITVATIDAPFFEIGGMKAEQWASSIKNRWEEHAESSSKLFSWVMNNSWHTNYKAEQEGITTFKYALRPHNKFDYFSTYCFGVEQSQPMITTFSSYSNKAGQLLRLNENSEIVITSLRQSRDGRGIMVRLFNPTNHECETTIELGNGTISLWASNGEEITKRLLDKRITLAPFEVKTLKLVFR